MILFGLLCPLLLVSRPSELVVWIRFALDLLQIQISWVNSGLCYFDIFRVQIII